MYCYWDYRGREAETEREKEKSIPTLSHGILCILYLCVSVVVNGSQADIVIVKRSDTAVHFSLWGHSVKLGYDCLGACCSSSRQ